MGELRQLRCRLQPLLRRSGASAELARACSVKRQQIYRWFPRVPGRAGEGKITAQAALLALRWLEERPRKKQWRYIPDWNQLRFMGEQLMKIPKIKRYVVAKLGRYANSDQIYNYFKTKRRNPSGEFALRFLSLVLRLRKKGWSIVPGLSSINLFRDGYDVFDFFKEYFDSDLERRRVETGRSMYF